MKTTSFRGLTSVLLLLSVACGYPDSDGSGPSPVPANASVLCQLDRLMPAGDFSGEGKTNDQETFSVRLHIDPSGIVSESYTGHPALKNVTRKYAHQAGGLIQVTQQQDFGDSSKAQASLSGDCVCSEFECGCALQGRDSSLRRTIECSSDGLLIVDDLSSDTKPNLRSTIYVRALTPKASP
jgi:hypothetical protein